MISKTYNTLFQSAAFTLALVVAGFPSISFSNEGDKRVYPVWTDTNIRVSGQYIDGWDFNNDYDSIKFIVFGLPHIT